MASSTLEERFFSGAELYGDDFDSHQIAQWFADERDAYAGLYGADSGTHEYGYSALNTHLGFSALPAQRRFRRVLGFGSNFDDELLPILDRIDDITLLDASDRYVVSDLRGVPVQYLLASVSGETSLETVGVDPITCFGVLHHISNVSKVLAEFCRVLAPSGWLLVREPATTMGDWGNARYRLTTRERGIPRNLFLSMLERSRLRFIRAVECYFPPWVRFATKRGIGTFKCSTATVIDSVLARAFSWNYTYHRTSLSARFAPASLFVVAERSVRHGGAPATVSVAAT
jgi:SAM-dependent methyltransferase